MKTIDKFFGEYRFLSNFWYHEQGMTVEHQFQAAKATNETDRLYVMDAPSPADAKKRGHEIMIRENWDLIKWSIMFMLVLEKFQPSKHPEMWAKLKATGDAPLVEGNMWHDQVFGKCNCFKHRGQGLNWLGEILMEVRDYWKGSYEDTSIDSA